MVSLDLPRDGHLTAAQEAEAMAHFRTHPPQRDTNTGREWLWETCGARTSRPGAIKLMNRIGFEWLRPARLPKHADPAVQKAFIADYERLVDGMPPDDKVVFTDAVYPRARMVHQGRSAGGLDNNRSAAGEYPRNPGSRGDGLFHAGERSNAETMLALFKHIEWTWPRGPHSPPVP